MSPTFQSHMIAIGVTEKTYGASEPVYRCEDCDFDMCEKCYQDSDQDLEGGWRFKRFFVFVCGGLLATPILFVVEFCSNVSFLWLEFEDMDSWLESYKGRARPFILRIALLSWTWRGLEIVALGGSALLNRWHHAERKPDVATAIVGVLSVFWVVFSVRQLVR